MWAIRFNVAVSSCIARRTSPPVLRSASRFNNILISRRIDRRLLSSEATAEIEAEIKAEAEAEPEPEPEPEPAAPEPSWKRPPRQKFVEINGTAYKRDSWFNVPRNVIEKSPRQLHLQEEHPISITREIIESVFPPPTFKYYNNLNPVVSTQQNFDSLGFPPDHPGRSKSDSYYINADTLLRTHTSAHQVDTFRANSSEGYLISADVYRRDEVDRSHYPIFHQMEGARSWDRARAPNGDVAAQIWSDVEKLPTHGVAVQDPNPPFHPERNPLQEPHHSPAEIEAVAAHLKRSLELTVVEIFSRVPAAVRRAKRDQPVDDGPLQVRWVEAYFPFTSPSWELEVYYGGDWLEVLGCGVVKHDIYVSAGVPDQLGWAFGIGLDRLAMLLFQIPDIRLFWSQDDRFLRQFKGASADDPASLRRFVPWSRHPGCWKDVSFWLDSTLLASGGTLETPAPAADFHENDVMEIVRGIAGDFVENVRLIDTFTHPKTGRRSKSYRINYRSLERNLTNKEVNRLHQRIERALMREYGVEVR